MFEDSYLDSYWEDQTEMYMGEDYNIFEERQLDLDRAFDDDEGFFENESPEWPDAWPDDDYDQQRDLDWEMEGEQCG